MAGGAMTCDVKMNFAAHTSCEPVGGSEAVDSTLLSFVRLLHWVRAPTWGKMNHQDGKPVPCALAVKTHPLHTKPEALLRALV